MSQFAQLRRIFYRSVYFLLLGALLLLLAVPSRAQQPQDPCTSALNPKKATVSAPLGMLGSATGCGQIITVVQVTNGAATEWAVTPATPPAMNGNPFDPKNTSDGDDVLIGIINQSGAPLTSITLTTPTGAATGVFGFDKDGVCHFYNADCFGATGYEGPDNTFTVTDPTFMKGTVNFTKALASGASTWFALEGIATGNAVQQGALIPNNGAGAVIFQANAAAGNEVQLEVDWSTANGIQNLNQPIPNPKLLTTNNAFSPDLWAEYVAGTPFAPSQCAQRVGLGGECNIYLNSCYNDAKGVSQSLDANCPAVSAPNNGANFITVEDTWDPPNPKPTNPPGTTTSLIFFTPPGAQLWTPSSTSPNQACPDAYTTPNHCLLADHLADMFGDQTTTRGGSPKTKAWVATAFGVPMVTTMPQVGANAGCPYPSSGMVTLDPNAWYNGNCLLNFLVNPASGSGNGFVAAPPFNLLYGPGAPQVQPGAVPAGDTLLYNPSPVCSGNPCVAQPWDTANDNVAVNPPPVVGTIPANNPQLSSFGPDGTYTLHWAASDAVGITEKNVQLNPAVGGQCPVPGGSVPGSQCYTTNYFTETVHTDSTAPTISLTSPTANAVYYLTETGVTATYSCSDPDGAVDTPTCVGTLPSGNPISTAMPNNYVFTVTSIDRAHNQTVQSVNYSVGDFSLGVSPSSPVTVSSGVGQPATYTVTVTPQFGLTGNVSVTCGGQIPPGSNCNVMPNVATLGGAPQTFQVVLNTSRNTQHGQWQLVFTANYPVNCTTPGTNCIQHTVQPGTLTVK